MQFYTSIAAFYDEIFPYDGEMHNFLKRHLSGDSFLELGCAAGTIVFSLYKDFAQSAGLDLDSELIMQAKKKMLRLPFDAQNKIRFIHGNMLDIARLFSAAQFDSIVCLGNTLAHLKSCLQIKTFFALVYGRLQGGGSFVFQIINYDTFLKKLEQPFKKNVHSLPIIETQNIIFKRNYSSMRIGGRIDFDTELFIKAQNQKIENSILLFPAKKRDLERMLEETGFCDIQFFGDFSDSLYGESSFLTIGLAKKNV